VNKLQNKLYKRIDICRENRKEKGLLATRAETQSKRERDNEKKTTMGKVVNFLLVGLMCLVVGYHLFVFRSVARVRRLEREVMLMGPSGIESRLRETMAPKGWIDIERVIEIAKELEEDDGGGGGLSGNSSSSSSSSCCSINIRDEKGMWMVKQSYVPFQRRWGCVSKVITLADGGVVSCMGRELIKWSTSTCLPVMEMSEHDNDLESVVELDEERVAVCFCNVKYSEINQIVIWNHRTGALLHTIRVLLRPRVLWKMKHKPFLLCGMTDGCVMMWNLAKNYELSHCFQLHDKVINYMCEMEDGMVVSATDDCIKVFNVYTRNCSMTFKGHNRRITAVIELKRLSTIKKVLASSSLDDTIRIWDVIKGGCNMILRGGYMGFTDVVELSGDCLASGSLSGIVVVWSLISGNPLLDITVLYSGIVSMARMRGEDGFLIVAGERSGMIQLYNTKSILLIFLTR